MSFPASPYLDFEQYGLIAGPGQHRFDGRRWPIIQPSRPVWTDGSVAALS
jgi:hypothetical protein